MKLKMDGEKVVLADGKPVYVYDDGKEVPFDAPAAMAKIGSLNAEAKGHREAKEAAERSLKAFEGIEDADAARKALETVKNLDEGKLLTAGKVEEIKAAAKRTAEETVAAAQKKADETIRLITTERDTFKTQLYDEKIGNAFARSKYIGDKIAIPVDIVQATFGGRFSVDEKGRIVGKGTDGSIIVSKTKFTDPADFEEAIETIVAEYPRRDQILKGHGSRGDGSRGGNGAGEPGGKVMTRKEFESLPHADRPAKIAEGYKLVD